MTAPKHLKPATAAWFSQVAADFDLEPHHLRLLTLAAEAWDRATEAREVLAAEGTYFRDRFDQPRAHPAVATERDSRVAFARLLREINLDAAPLPETPRPPRLGRK